jgi:hypothetical protein
LIRFGFITSNKWNTFIQEHTTPEVIALSNDRKELNKKNKFKHKLGPSEYKAAIAIWTKKEQKLSEAGIPNPLEGCARCTQKIGSGVGLV